MVSTFEGIGGNVGSLPGNADGSGDPCSTKRGVGIDVGPVGAKVVVSIGGKVNPVGSAAAVGMPVATGAVVGPNVASPKHTSACALKYTGVP